MANWWSLKIISGPEAGKVFLLNRDRTVIGRVKGDVLLRQDLELSSVHAEIVFDAAKGILILADLQSRNGCRVNGDKIEKRALVAGDKIRFGVTELVLEPPSAEQTIVSSYESDATRVAADRPAEKAQDRDAAKSAANDSRDSREDAVKGAAKNASPADASERGDAAKSSSKDSAKDTRDSASTARSKIPTTGPVRESESDSYRGSRDSSPSGPEFYGFLGRFIGVVFSPTRFFDFLASENALISGDQAFRSAIQFGLIFWLLGGAIAGGLSYLCLFVWKTNEAGADYGSSPFAIGLITLLGPVLVPLVALLYHGACLAVGGKGPFKVALRVVCYLTAIHFLQQLVILVPKVGPFAAMSLQCYALYLMALAATRLYFVTIAAAYASCAVSVAIALAVMITSRSSAMRFQDQLAKLNPVLSKSIGASIVVTSPNPSQTTTQQAKAAAPVPETETHAQAAVQTKEPPAADPTPPPESDAANTTSAPSSNDRDPAAATDAKPAAASSDATTNSGSSNSDGDPTPPQLPSSSQ